MALYQSINSPHLAIPGKQAGPAQAFIVGVRAASGFGIFVYLYLAEVGDCAVYASDQRNLTPEQFRDEEAEAIGFVESMGFMMDNLNFANLQPDQKEEILRTLPPFVGASVKAQQQSPGASPQQAEAKKSPVTLLGRILSSF